MRMDLSACFAPEHIERTAQDLCESLPDISDWIGATRLDIATEIGVTVHLLEKAMKLNIQLTEYVQYIEQKTLLTDVTKLRTQLAEKKINSQLVKLYFGVRHGITDRTVDGLFKNLDESVGTPSIKYLLRSNRLDAEKKINNDD